MQIQAAQLPAHIEPSHLPSFLLPASILVPPLAWPWVLLATMDHGRRRGPSAPRFCFRFAVCARAHLVHTSYRTRTRHARLGEGRGPQLRKLAACTTSVRPVPSHARREVDVCGHATREGPRGQLGAIPPPGSLPSWDGGRPLRQVQISLRRCARCGRGRNLEIVLF